MLMLSAIHFCKNNIIYSKYVPGSSTDTCLDNHIVMKTATAKIRWYNVNIERGCACFQKKYYKVCIGRAGSHTVHLWFASTAVLLPFRP